MIVSPISFEIVTCLSSDANASSLVEFHAPALMRRECLPMILCFLSVRLS